MALEPLIATVNVNNGEDVVTVTDQVLTPLNCRAGGAVAIDGFSTFIKARLTTTTFQLSRNWPNATVTGGTAEIAPFTAEMASRVELSQNLQTYNANLVLFEAYRRGLYCLFSAETDLSDPGPGHVAFDTADLTAITAMVISDTDASGQSQAARVADFKEGDKLTIRTVDTDNFVTVTLTEAATRADPGDTFQTIANLTVVETDGEMAADNYLTVEITPAGNAGADGADGLLSGTQVVKTGNYTLLAGDSGKTFVANSASAIEFALTGADPLGDGWGVVVKNENTGTLTINPDASETIDGAATLDLAQGQSRLILCNGTAFRTVFAGGGATGSESILNKAGSSDTAKVEFQTGASGRARIGTLGDDDLTVQVSADGSAWTDALTVDRTTGKVSLPQNNVLENYAANLYQDSGRLGDGTTHNNAGTYQWPAYFTTLNSASQASEGKFIFNNNDYGGSAGTLNANVKALIDKIRSATEDFRRYSVEFYVARITAGAGTGATFTADSTTFYSTIISAFRLRPPALTWHGYLRAITDTIAVAVQPSQTHYKDGAEQSANYTITVAEGWVSITIHDNVDPYFSYGYQPNIFQFGSKAASDAYLLACPALMAGITGVDDNIGLIAAYNRWPAT